MYGFSKSYVLFLSNWKAIKKFASERVVIYNDRSESQMSPRFVIVHWRPEQVIVAVLP